MKLNIINYLILCCTDPFDCERDPCHLAWIIDDNRHLLHKLVLGATMPRCSNGTLFKSLDRKTLSRCEFQGRHLVKFLGCQFYFFYILFAFSDLESQLFCPNEEDYSPCICSENFWLHCNKIPLEKIGQIFKGKHVGNRTNVLIHDLKLTMPPTNTTIPANLLANHYVNFEIELKCLEGRNQQIEIDSDAFATSKNFTQIFKMSLCDVFGFNFLFLRGFNKLQRLALFSIINVHLAHWATLPPLPGLNILEITESKGLSQWTQFPTLKFGMKYVDLIGNEMGDTAIDRILNWILESSSSENILEFLDMAPHV